MNTREAIAARRSIRSFKPDPVPADLLQAILTAGIQAPSGKNKQPWRFVVVTGDKRAEMVQVMRRGLAQLKARGMNLGSAEGSAAIMEQAPVTVFVFNAHGVDPWATRDFMQVFTEMVDIQSIGAAIENMLLAALDLGIGSLWICDIFFAYPDLCQWLGEPGQMIAALCFGYPNISPPARPRKAVGEVTRWIAQQV